MLVLPKLSDLFVRTKNCDTKIFFKNFLWEFYLTFRETPNFNQIYFIVNDLRQTMPRLAIAYRFLDIVIPLD